MANTNSCNYPRSPPEVPSTVRQDSSVQTLILPRWNPDLEWSANLHHGMQLPHHLQGGAAKNHT